MPILVLSSEKKIVLANEAVGRLLGIDDGLEDEELDPLTPPANGEAKSATDTLYGMTLPQLGVDILQNGSIAFIAWEELLETLVDDASRAQSSTTRLNTHHDRGLAKEETPLHKLHRRSVSQSSSRFGNANGSKTEVHDSVVEVVFSTQRDNKTGLPLIIKLDVASHVQAQLIVSVWTTEDDYYFTLTFTASSEGSSPPDNHHGSKTTSRTVSKSAASLNSIGSAISSQSSSTSSSGVPHRHTHAATISTPPTSVTSGMPSPRPPVDFPPKGPPGKFSAAAPTMFGKTSRLKDAILDSMNMPAFAMWKDESFGIPNKAAVKLLFPWLEDGTFDYNEQAREVAERFILYDEDFATQIPHEDFPMNRLMREKVSFDGYRVGMYSAKDGHQLLFDASGERLTDGDGEFLGGLVILKDVTDYAKAIEDQKKENESQFENITNYVPQMIWRTTPDGSHDYYSARWYSYTGLTTEESSGEGWTRAFHPDDLAIAEPKWRHSLATGDEYLTEYRCRSANGEWRWMLGRAVPMRDLEGSIVKWFGTCTDIHELVLAREEAKQTRAYLQQVIEHSQITLWAVDRDHKLRLFEGRPMWYQHPGQSMEDSFRDLKSRYIGMDIEDILKSQGREEELDIYGPAMKKILGGKENNETVEIHIPSNGRSFKTKLFPLLKQDRPGGVEGEAFVDGVVGISMDITELKKAAEEVEKRNKENSRLMAQSVAAKEASKMKSQFLANMSHEIRTPIAGVIGMSELLLDDDSGGLSKEQRECAENISRSANSLLVVINDILDFSKVEAGQLHVEEVQFDLSLLVQDVNKMLSFAAERKGLKYVDDIEELKSWKLMGDPGRLKQVLTNLLTNSIKFTSEGCVTMRVKVNRETSDTLELSFTVEDTGIGIEEEVRSKLFQPFSQADNSTARRFGGTGLGLSISKNLVELMHGKLWLDSQLGMGTKATFWIPFQKAPYQADGSRMADVNSAPDVSLSHSNSVHSVPPIPSTPSKDGHKRESSEVTIPAEQPQERLEDAERKNIQVLVVEDNAVNQQIALKTIKKLGFPVNAVWNGKEALDYLQNPSQKQPLPDIILMDVQMPVMDGYRATYTIRNGQPFANNADLQSLPIVAMTASAIQGDREKCESAGMDDYLAKPVTKPILEKMLVKWAIEGRRKRAEIAKNPAKASRPRRPTVTRKHSSFALNHIR